MIAQLRAMFLFLFQIMDGVNWSMVNTTLLIGAIGFMWRQTQSVSEIRQILFGAKGQKGLLGRFEAMEATSDLRAEQAGASAAGREILAKYDGLLARVIELELSNRNRRMREADGEQR